MADTQQHLLPESLVELAGRVISENAAAGRTVALAESCTGGLVTAALTEIPGSSAVVNCGYVTYSNQAKIDAVNVSEELIETFGAVSVAVAWAMARGALARSGADIAVAITGVAGPDGGTDEKPVGTVVFARALKDQKETDIDAEQKQFGSTLSRAELRLLAAQTALELLLP
ncbi:MAG: CinA family protein [Blastomonas sp.]